MPPTPCLPASCDAWDSIWADFDQRRPAIAPPEAEPCPRPARRGRLRRRWPGLMVLALAMPAAWASEPALLAAGLLKGPARQDLGALDERIDWSAVAPALARDLRAAGGQGHGAGAARFLDTMAGEMAEAWQNPARRDAVLQSRAGTGATELRWSAAGLRFAEAAGPGAPPPAVGMRPPLVAF